MAYFSEQIGLVTRHTMKDAEGYEVESTTEIHFVYGNCQSVTQTEFFSAGQQGIDAKCKFTVYASEYGGQDEIMYHNRYFNVYRTYKVKEDLMELYASEAMSEGEPVVSG